MRSQTGMNGNIRGSAAPSIGKRRSCAAVNAGLREATGIFFKVVDSDDWVNKQAYVQVLNTLRRFVYGKDTLDMLITNFVYEKQGAKHKKVMNYNTALPKNEVFTWDDVKVFIAGQYILMHSVIYRTELLRDCGLELPMHTFYVDNIFVYEPLPHVRKMYYLDVNFYGISLAVRISRSTSR